MVLLVYIVVGAIGVIIAAVLVYTATRSLSKAKDAADGPGESSQDLSYRQDVYNEVNELMASESQGKEVSEKIARIFDRELEKRINQTSQELSRKYETIIKEKNQNEEVAWKKYKRVLEDKNETEAIVRSIAEGLVVVNAEGKVIMMNPAAEKLLGVSSKDKIGKPITQDLREEQLVSLARNAPGQANREIELISQEDETKKTLRASTAVIEDADGQTIGMVSVLSDITKQKELDRMKSNFMASVSHELRMPMVIMQKSLFLIRDEFSGRINPSQEQFLSIIERNLKRLTLLINDLLDLSKLEAGKMELKRQPTSVKKVIEESVEGLNAWAGTKSISIERNIAPELPEANIDPNRINQVLNNLIGNAIKFTPANGKITVEAGYHKEKGEIVVGIQDTGIGIAKENLLRVFDKFYQVGERVSTDISGTGIGLSIAKEIVELHGGKIWVESPDKQGARFTFTLPL